MKIIILWILLIPILIVLSPIFLIGGWVRLVEGAFRTGYEETDAALNTIHKIMKRLQ